MNLKPFNLERYFAQYEFSARYLLSSSDCDGLSQSELLSWADSETRDLWDSLTLGYTESLGHPLLRAEIAGLYTNITPEDCLVIVPEEGIFLTMQAVLQPGDHVICTFPGYQSLYAIAESLGCMVTKWEPEEDTGWRFNPDFLEEAIRPDTKLVIVNFPHNPTGYLPSKEDFQQILEIVQKQHVYLFSDEMYRFLEYDPNLRLPSACEVYDKAITLFGMSKTFGMAGVRIGWVVTKDKNIYSKLVNLKDYTTICSSAPSEILSIIGLRAKDRIIARHLARIDRNLSLLDSFFEEYQDLFAWHKPKAGTICFPKLLANKNALDFCQKVVKDANIMLLPSTVYDFGDHYFRLGFGRENFPEALEKLQDYLHS